MNSRKRLGYDLKSGMDQYFRVGLSFRAQGLELCVQQRNEIQYILFAKTIFVESTDWD